MAEAAPGRLREAAGQGGIASANYWTPATAKPLQTQNKLLAKGGNRAVRQILSKFGCMPAEDATPRQTSLPWADRRGVADLPRSDRCSTNLDKSNFANGGGGLGKTLSNLGK